MAITLFEKSDHPAETVYELADMRPMNSVFIARLVAGLAFAYSMFWMPFFFFKIIFCLIAVATLVPLFKEVLHKHIKSLRMTEDFLELQQGVRNNSVVVYYDQIRKVEIVERYQQRGRRYQRKKRSEVSTVLFENKQFNARRSFDPDAKCVITLNNGRIVEVDGRYFKDGDFEEFMDHFEQLYGHALGHDTQQSSENISGRSRFRLNIPGQAQNTGNSNAPARKRPLSPEEIKTEKLLDKNRSYLKKDFALKEKFEGNLIQTYREIYYSRDAFDITKMHDTDVIYSFKNPDNSTAYILDGDYLPRIKADYIEAVKNIIQATHKNIKLVETRIAYHKKIEKRLEDYKFHLKKQIRLKELTQNLEELQEMNTNIDIEQSTMSDLEADTDILFELEELTQQVHDLEDLEKAVMLNEHISLFKEDDTNKGENPTESTPGS